MDDRLTTDSSVAAGRFDRVTGMAAIAGALFSLLYAVAFVVLKSDQIAAGALMAGGLFSAVALIGLYERVKSSGGLATVGVVFGIAGTLGAAIHGAYDLAVILGPDVDVPAILPVPVVGPNFVDPRGFLTFGVAGLGVLILSWAALSVAFRSRSFAYLGFVLGALLVVIYLGRLFILDANNPLILGPGALASIVVGPLWYGWLGWMLLTGRSRGG
jgi:hypothetical protein